MLMNKKWLIPVFLLIILTLLSGGTDAVDINRTVFVTGVGIDRSGDGYSFSFYNAVPAGSDTAISENNVEYRCVTIDSDSMADAVRRMEQGTSREISFEHLGCTAIGSSAVEDDLPVMLDFLLREPTVRRQSSLMALECSAEEFFSAPFSGSIASAAASALERLDDSRCRSGIMTLGRLSGAVEHNTGFCLYVLDLGEESAKTSGSDAAGPASVELSGLAVYNRDGLGGILDRDDAELARLFIDRQTSGLITCTDYDGNMYYYDITYSDCSLRFEQGNPCRGYIDLKTECLLIENGGADALPPDNSALSKSLYQQLSRLITLSRTCGSALTGLENEARQSAGVWYRTAGDDWDNIYRRMEITLTVSCAAERRSGKT